MRQWQVFWLAYVLRTNHFEIIFDYLKFWNSRIETLPNANRFRPRALMVCVSRVQRQSFKVIVLQLCVCVCLFVSFCFYFHVKRNMRRASNRKCVYDECIDFDVMTQFHLAHTTHNENHKHNNRIIYFQNWIVCVCVSVCNARVVITYVLFWMGVIKHNPLFYDMQLNWFVFIFGTTNWLDPKWLMILLQKKKKTFS